MIDTTTINGVSTLVYSTKNVKKSIEQKSLDD